MRFGRFSQADYEAFEGLSVDPQGHVIGIARRNEAVLRAAQYYWDRCATRAILILELSSTALFVCYGIIRKLLERSALVTLGS